MTGTSSLAVLLPIAMGLTIIPPGGTRGVGTPRLAPGVGGLIGAPVVVIGWKTLVAC